MPAATSFTQPWGSISLSRVNQSHERVDSRVEQMPTPHPDFPSTPNFALGTRITAHTHSSSTAISNGIFICLASSAGCCLALPLERNKPFFPGLAAQRNALKGKKAIVVPCDSETQPFFGGDLGRISPSAVKLGLPLVFKLVAIRK